MHNRHIEGKGANNDIGGITAAVTFIETAAEFLGIRILDDWNDMFNCDFIANTGKNGMKKFLIIR